jgi:hypothetical protein
MLRNAVRTNTKYRGADDTFIKVDIFKDDKIFRLRVQNSNYTNITVFSNSKGIFDYDIVRYGSKQNVHVVSSGMLGDAMKQILSFGYLLTNVHWSTQSNNNKNRIQGAVSYTYRAIVQSKQYSFIQT